MQQRQPRLGDILDDYCPRERRVTNHAVVAMVGEDVKQTRCTTCDAEHEYKQARVPAQRKKKEGASALYEEVLAGMPRKLGTAAPAAAPVAGDPKRRRRGQRARGRRPESRRGGCARRHPACGRAAARRSDGPVHRALIRATLPRPEGQVKERQIPEFTARTAATRSRALPSTWRRARRAPRAGPGTWAGRRPARWRPLRPARPGSFLLCLGGDARPGQPCTFQPRRSAGAAPQGRPEGLEVNGRLGASAARTSRLRLRSGPPASAATLDGEQP